MTTKERMNSPNKTARIAGLLYLIMVPFAVFGSFYVNSLIVPGEAAITANNFMASESLIRLSIVSALFVQIGHILLVLVLYKLLKPVNKNIAALMVIFLLVGVPIAMLNQLNQIAALILVSGADYLPVFEAGQLHAQVMLFLDLYDYGAQIAVIFWGLWLFPFGYLVFKSGYIPRILGVLLIIGGFGYLIDFFTSFLLPNYANYEAILLVVIPLLTIPGELLLPLWLLIKGVNVEQWEKRALESS
ncbi:DUF4386 domain-containing protein [Chloroflexota bacterium]